MSGQTLVWPSECPQRDVHFVWLCCLFSLPLTTFLNISPFYCHHLLRTHTQQLELKRLCFFPNHLRVGAPDGLSCFTNIPVSLAIDVARRRQDESLSECTTLPVEGILMLLQLCLNAICLSFRGTCNYYRQVFGTALGCPLSETVANLVMEEIEEQALSACYPRPKFWKRSWMMWSLL